MRIILLAVFMLALAAQPADASHARLSPERAAARARIVADRFITRSATFSDSSVRTGSCVRIGTTRHRRRCPAVLIGRKGLRCTIRVNVRYVTSTSLLTVGFTSLRKLTCS